MEDYFDLTRDWVIKMICRKRQSFQSSFQKSMLLPKYLWSTYQHEVERHEMGANFALNHLREKDYVIQGWQQVKRCIEYRMKQEIQRWFSPNGTITQNLVGNDAKNHLQIVQISQVHFTQL